MVHTRLPAPTTLDPGHRVYAIGDVHGCRAKLAALHLLIAADLREQPAVYPQLIHLGDYIDRGEDSAGVIRHLLAGGPAIPTVNLMGNHEQMMLSALEDGDPDTLRHWLANGGAAAMRSWDVSAPAISLLETGRLIDRIPPDHLRFLRGLVRSHRAGGYLFVHAGIRPGVPLVQQSMHDLMWIREPFLSWPESLGVVVVHGHTPSEGPVVKSNRIGIDTAAVLGGPLTCLVLEGNRLRFLYA